MSVASSSLDQQALHLPLGPTASALPQPVLGTHESLARAKGQIPGTHQAVLDPGREPGPNVSPVFGMEENPGTTPALTQALEKAPGTQEALQRVTALVSTLTPATEVSHAWRALLFHK